MKTLKTIFAALVIVSFASVSVSAQNVASQSADAAATIIAPLTLANNVALNFGNVASGSAAGSVLLGTDGERTPSNVVLPSVPGTVTAAQFTVTGLAEANYEITLPTSTTITDGTNNMTINNFVHDADEVLTAGTETFNVGATLNVAANQDAGLYEGTFNVTVDYN